MTRFAEDAVLVAHCRFVWACHCSRTNSIYQRSNSRLVAKIRVNCRCYSVSSRTETAMWPTATLAAVTGPRDGARLDGARCYLRPPSVAAARRGPIVGQITSRRRYKPSAPHRALPSPTATATRQSPARVNNNPAGQNLPPERSINQSVTHLRFFQATMAINTLTKHREACREKV